MMFDKKTQKALESLTQEDLKKVSMMIQKLSNKSVKKSRQAREPKKAEAQVGIASTRPSNKPSRIRSEPVPTGPRENLFENMQEFNDFKEDEEVAKKLYTKPPTPRNRKTNLVQVNCITCGKEQSVASSLVPVDRTRYICNNCQVRGAKG